MDVESRPLVLVKSQPLSVLTTDILPTEADIEAQNYLRTLRSLERTEVVASPLTDQRSNSRCLYKWEGFSISIIEGEEQDERATRTNGEAIPIMFVEGVLWKPGMAVPSDTGGSMSMINTDVLQDSTDGRGD